MNRQSGQPPAWDADLCRWVESILRHDHYGTTVPPDPDTLARLGLPTKEAERAS